MKWMSLSAAMMLCCVTSSAQAGMFNMFGCGSGCARSAQSPRSRRKRTRVPRAQERLCRRMPTGPEIANGDWTLLPVNVLEAKSQFNKLPRLGPRFAKIVRTQSEHTLEHVAAGDVQGVHRDHDAGQAVQTCVRYDTSSRMTPTAFTVIQSRGRVPGQMVW